MAYKIFQDHCDISSKLPTVFFLSSTILSRVCDLDIHFKLKKVGGGGNGYTIGYISLIFLSAQTPLHYCVAGVSIWGQNNFPQLLKDLHSTQLKKIN